MEVREQVPLASLTTLRAGGNARFAAACASVDDVRAALTFSKERALPWYVLGEGSNVLASDAGYDGVIIVPRIRGMTIEEEGEHAVLTAGAGESWEAVVLDAAAHGLWGIENLAGIPGTAGAAPVQNIGAYGTELADTLLHVDALEVATGKVTRMMREACEFGYRESRFKRGQEFVIVSIALSLARAGAPNLSYADLARAKEGGADLCSPSAVGKAVRAIRARKFPDLAVCGTAGSFFKNPVVSKERYEALAKSHPDMPQYLSGGGVKIPLAFILDRVLGLKGFHLGRARLFEAQPLVLVLEDGGTAEDAERLARFVEEKVFSATGIRIEREVRTLA